MTAPSPESRASRASRACRAVPALFAALVLLAGCAMATPGDWERHARVVALLSHAPLPDGVDASCLHGADPRTLDLVVLRFRAGRDHHAMAFVADPAQAWRVGAHGLVNPATCTLRETVVPAPASDAA